MPVEAKPLFRFEVIRPHLSGYRLPANALETMAKWGEMLATGLADEFKEKELLPDFLSDIFVGVLGYTRAVDDGNRWSVSWEKHVEVDGKYADAVLGDFRVDRKRFIAVVEGKGPRDPLERPHAGRRMSAIDQGYRYAINLPCDWIIVTSMRQTRLYFKGSDQYTYEKFDTETMARDEFQLKRFVFLLGASRVVPESGPCHLIELRNASEKIGKDLTKEFYVKYTDMREDAFLSLCQANPNLSPQHVLSLTQKILDRVLFCAFCEDRGLLPSDTIHRAYHHSDPYNRRPIWENFQGLFRAVNKGNLDLKIPAYNGGLFAEDPALDALAVPDSICKFFMDLASYEYRAPHDAPNGESKLIDVDILGHIFEQSISDLERIRNELEGLTERLDRDQHASHRKKEGAFYTPPFITRYIIEQALGSVLKDRFEALRLRYADQAKGASREILANPAVYDLTTIKSVQKKTLIRFWEAWQDEGLSTVRIVDPACGSGAFLIEAFEQLYQTYERSNDRLEELRGNRTLFDLDKHILQNNIYGVDLNSEAIEIARLSLWIKTAQRGKPLTSLEHTIREGNSVVDDRAFDARAFDWRAAFPEVFNEGGFDVVVGNPPYVRQEWISAFKPYFQREYKTYHGTADLYVYFYELGMRILKPGGRLSFVVTNKWLKTGYGEPLRRFFAEETWVESLVDFGHAKQIFPDADVFPSIIVARNPVLEAEPAVMRICAIPREQLRVDDLSNQIAEEGIEVETGRLKNAAWSMESTQESQLIEKLRSVDHSIADLTGFQPLSGIKTGLNHAFLVDTMTRDAMIKADPRCSSILRPYMRGRDLTRWHPDWAGLWMIALKSSGDYIWPWSHAGERAEEVFKSTYPSIYNHLKTFEKDLIKRQDQGHNWWELRSCAYWDMFDSPKIMYQEITWQLQWCLDTLGTLCNNTAYVLPSTDSWILAALNAPVTWWYAWRTAVHGKDEALRFIKDYVQLLPVPTPSQEQRELSEQLVPRLIEIAGARVQLHRDLLDWLKVEHEVATPNTKLQRPILLDTDAFVAEVRKVRGKKKPLSLAALRSLREEHTRTILPAQTLAREALELERKLSDLVNEAYSLTPDEIRLMWETAPPRMPIPAPALETDGA